MRTVKNNKQLTSSSMSSGINEPGFLQICFGRPLQLPVFSTSVCQGNRQCRLGLVWVSCVCGWCLLEQGWEILWWGILSKVSVPSAILMKYRRTYCFWDFYHSSKNLPTGSKFGGKRQKTHRQESWGDASTDKKTSVFLDFKAAYASEPSVQKLMIWLKTVGLSYNYMVTLLIHV